MAKMPPRGKAASKLLENMPDPTDEGPSAQEAIAPPAPEDVGGDANSNPIMQGGPLPDSGAPLPPDAGTPPDEPDVDTALSGVEAAIQGFSEDASREIRTHIEAIKDIASRETGREESQEQIQGDAGAQPPPDMPSSADIGDAMGLDERR